MKRKHGSDTSDTPAPAIATTPTTSTTPLITTAATPTTTTSATTTTMDTEATFESLGLDARLLQGVAKLGFAHPTLVQAKAIPLALEGKDILARAKTGSGKTAAYLLPILQGILTAKDATPTAKTTRALVLVPTRELAEQVTKMAGQLAQCCGKPGVRAVNIAHGGSEALQRALLADVPDVVVATPGRAVAHLGLLAGASQLVIDEADLVLAYGYDDDLQAIARALPRGLQTFLMSATLTDEVDTLKKLFCRRPVILRLHEADPGPGAADGSGGVAQYIVKCAEDEKFLLAYIIFKLKLLKGKTIVFVGDIDRCYRLKLFLEQFGIRSCVLNSELPVNSRLHIVDEFNKGVYDIILATDEHEVVGGDEDDGGDDDDGEEAPGKKAKRRRKVQPPSEQPSEDAAPAPAPAPTEGAPAPAGAPKTPAGKKQRKRQPRLDKEYGVARGIDFQHVACVLNFDLPTSSRSYTHRIGRTARAGRAGLALSFAVPEPQHGRHKPTAIASTARDEAVLAAIARHQARRGARLQPYVFDPALVRSFRYRADDALRAVTRTAIREARTRELRHELLTSDRLKRHFEENPADLRHLRHDADLRPARVQPHLRHVPDYLLPKAGAAALAAGAPPPAAASAAAAPVGLRKSGAANRIRKARERNKKVRKPKGKGKGRDPLKMFKGKGKA